MSSRALAPVLGLLLALGAATPVLGHVSLKTSDPEAGATVPRADSVTLVFDERLDRSISSFKLVAPDGSTIGSGAPAAPRTLRLDGLELAPGEYTIRWTAAGEDGHIERGRFRFTVTEPPVTDSPATPGASPTAAPSSGAETTPVATAAPEASPEPEPEAAPGPEPEAAADSVSGTDVLIPIVAGLAFVGIVGVLVLRRSRTA